MPAATLAEILSRSRVEGYLGPGSIDVHVDHGRAHLGAADPRPGSNWLDLGSGGGLPGLVMAAERPDLHLTLLDRSQKRTDFLRQAVRELELTQVEVVTSDASDFAREAAHRATFDGVVSRSFGAPALVAEVSCALLRTGGRLVVSEPPQDQGGSAEPGVRWPRDALHLVGFGDLAIRGNNPSFAILTLTTLPPADRPRRWAQMVKRPLFGPDEVD